MRPGGCGEGLDPTPSPPLSFSFMDPQLPPPHSSSDLPCSRRRLLALAGLGAGALALPPALRSAPVWAQGGAGEVVEIDLEAVTERLSLRSGPLSEIWRYQATLLRGPSDSLSWTQGPLPLPVLRLRRGQELRVRFRNRLPEATTVHWHGLAVPESMDGHPKDAVPAGGERLYSFPILAEAATYWFHPHPHMRTAFQVAQGLAGFLLVEDPAAEAGLPKGEQDLPLFIQDRTLDAQNGNAYAQHMMGFLGDEVAVNGQTASTALPVAAAPYRLRLLNGSITRTYKLAWDDGRPLTALSTDAGLLPQPLDRPYLMLAPGERRDVLVDFGGLPPGAGLSLRSLPWNTGASGGMNRPTRLPEGIAFAVARFRVQAARRVFLPALLRAGTLSRPGPAGAGPRQGTGNRAGLPPKPGPEAQPLAASQAAADRTFVLDHRMMQWTINGRSFEMEAVAQDEVLRLGAEETWDWVNASTTMMRLPHAMHVHLVRFQVIQREGDPQLAAAYGTVKEGLLDEGWKDTVLVMPGERVRIRLRVEGYSGLFLYHCHMLDHEDMGMMRNFRVLEG